MSGLTPIYSLPYADSTDDISAYPTLDQSAKGLIDDALDTIATVAGGKVSKAVVTTKGDLLAATGSGVVDRLAAGANGKVLVADSAEATGLKWDTAGGEKLLSSTALTGASVTVSVISQDYKHLRIVLYGVKEAAASATLVKPNAVNGNFSGNSLEGSALLNFKSDLRFNTHTSRTSVVQYTIYDYAQAREHVVQWNGAMEFGGAIAPTAGFGVHFTAAAITSLVLAAGSSLFTGGTVEIYGVN